MSSKWTSFGPIVHNKQDRIEEKEFRTVLFQKVYHGTKDKTVGGQHWCEYTPDPAEKRIKQTELVRMIQLRNVNMTREALVKIERGIQHITLSQLRGFRDCLDTTYEELLK